MATMKRANKFVKVSVLGNILKWTDSTSQKQLDVLEVPVTSNEFAVIDIVKGDLQLAKNIIRDIEDRIAEKIQMLDKDES